MLALVLRHGANALNRALPTPSRRIPGVLQRAVGEEHALVRSSPVMITRRVASSDIYVDPEPPHRSVLTWTATASDISGRPHTPCLSLVSGVRPAPRYEEFGVRSLVVLHSALRPGLVHPDSMIPRLVDGQARVRLRFAVLQHHPVRTLAEMKGM